VELRAATASQSIDIANAALLARPALPGMTT
jgi:hypothetical protein